MSKLHKIRVKKIQKELHKNNLDGIIFSSCFNINYLTNLSNFDFVEREAFLLILKNQQFIFTDKRYSEAVKRLIPHFNLQEISSQNSFYYLLEKLIKEYNLKTVGIE